MTDKVKRLTKVEKFYIEKNHMKNIQTVAKDLKRKVAEIEKYYNQCVEEHAQKNKLTVKKLMTGVKNKAVIMTPQASELGDAVRKTGSSNLDKSYIHKLDED